MTREELIKIDSNLELTKIADQFLAKKRGYYVYYNVPNKLTHALLIHHHTCGHCKYGIGRLTNAKAGENGAWIGPSHSIEGMRAIILDIFGIYPALCTCCQ